MRNGLLGVGLVFLLGLPGRALANRVTDLSFSVRKGDAVIAVTAAEPLNDPRVRSGREGLKVWFPDVAEDVRWDLKGDGQAIGKIRLRPGARGTALLYVELHRSRPLPREAVTAEAQGNRFFLRIAGDALPELNTKLAVGEEVPVAKGPVQGQTLAQQAVVETKKDAVLAEEDGQEESGLLSTEQAATDGDLLLGSGPAVDLTPLYVFLLLGVAGMAGFGFLRKVRQKMPTTEPRPQIQLLGARRLGTRHQLLLIRALGEDHLLLVNGDRTERISSSPAPYGDDMTLSELGPGEELDDEQVAAAQQALAGSPDTLQGEAAGGEERSGKAAELLKFVQRRSGGGVRGAESSPAVQGLLKLRREVG